MHRIFPCLLAAAVGMAAMAFSSAPQAATKAAGWNIISTGVGSFASDPSCARYTVSSAYPRNANNSGAVCAALSPTGIVWFNVYSGASKKFGTWTRLSNETPASYDPSCVPAGSASVVCAARGQQGNLLVYQYSNGALSEQLTLTTPALLATAPSCGLNVRAVQCLAPTASGNQFVQALFKGGAWSAANWSLTAPKSQYPILSQFSCATDDNVTNWCSTLTTSSNGMAVAAISGGIYAYDHLGGIGTNPPVCTYAGIVGDVVCFATGTDSALYSNVFNGTNWGGWNSMQGLVHGYGCAEFGDKAKVLDLVCGATGLIDSGFWVDIYGNGAWSGWSEPGTGTYLGNPSCIALTITVTPGAVMCMILRTDGGMEAAINHAP